MTLSSTETNKAGLGSPSTPAFGVWDQVILGFIASKGKPGLHEIDPVSNNRAFQITLKVISEAGVVVQLTKCFYDPLHSVPSIIKNKNKQNRTV